MQKYYTPAELAKLLRVRKSYVYELLSSRRIKSIRLSERRTRIPESEVEEYLSKKLN